MSDKSYSRPDFYTIMENFPLEIFVFAISNNFNGFCDFLMELFLIVNDLTGSFNNSPLKKVFLSLFKVSQNDS